MARYNQVRCYNAYRFCGVDLVWVRAHLPSKFSDKLSSKLASKWPDPSRVEKFKVLFIIGYSGKTPKRPTQYV